jgi:hypothetical protein
VPPNGLDLAVPPRDCRSRIAPRRGSVSAMELLDCDRILPVIGANWTRRWERSCYLRSRCPHVHAARLVRHQSLYLNAGSQRNASKFCSFARRTDVVPAPHVYHLRSHRASEWLQDLIHGRFWATCPGDFCSSSGRLCSKGKIESQRWRRLRCGIGSLPS